MYRNSLNVDKTHPDIIIANTIIMTMRDKGYISGDDFVHRVWLHAFFFMMHCHYMYTYNELLFTVEFYKSYYNLIHPLLADIERNSNIGCGYINAKNIPYAENANGDCFKLKQSHYMFDRIVELTENIIDCFGVNDSNIVGLIIDDLKIDQYVENNSIITTDITLEMITNFMSTKPDVSDKINNIKDNVIYLKTD